MSHTKRGSKAPGYEYWSKRPNMSGGVGRWAKTKCHRIERQAGKRLARQEQE